MRLFARRAGFSLSDHGICEAAHARGVGRGQRLWTGPPIAQQHFLEEKDWLKATRMVNLWELTKNRDLRGLSGILSAQMVIEWDFVGFIIHMVLFQCLMEIS